LSFIVGMMIERPETVQYDIHRDIIERSRKGDRRAQYELYRLYSKAMFNICLRMLNKRAEAEDMLQEIFVDAFARLASFRFDSTFGAWLKKIAVNKCINEINRRKTELEFVEDLEFYDTADDHDQPDEQDLKLGVERIRKAMEQLPDGSRLVFSLYLFEGYDHEEIAGIMGIAESTSKTQFMRAKQKVKELLIVPS
jgi:RNA polymerase sigma factor (sigma-70 family)